LLFYISITLILRLVLHWSHMLYSLIWNAVTFSSLLAISMHSLALVLVFFGADDKLRNLLFRGLWLNQFIMSCPAWCADKLEFFWPLQIWQAFPFKFGQKHMFYVKCQVCTQVNLTVWYFLFYKRFLIIFIKFFLVMSIHSPKSLTFWPLLFSWKQCMPLARDWCSIFFDRRSTFQIANLLSSTVLVSNYITNPSVKSNNICSLICMISKCENIFKSLI